MLPDIDERVLDENYWYKEADAVINDVKSHLNDIKISLVLQSTNRHIYLNLTTLELNTYCIELSGLGFRIVGKSYDISNINNEQWFETPYSLLNSISPLFNLSFGNCLLEKLNQLPDENKEDQCI